MKNTFVPGGEWALLNGQNAKKLEAARAKHADEWAKADFFKRIRLRCQIQREVLRQQDTHKPSPETLW